MPPKTPATNAPSVDISGLLDDLVPVDTRGIGIDIGTMGIISARRTPTNGIETRRMRNAFLDLDPSARKMLKLSGANFIERPDELLIVGDEALAVANVFGKEARRPLQAGLLAAGEIDALEVLALMIKSVLGPPTVKNEVCYFCVPAAPVNAPGTDVIYHKGVLDRIVTECGYDAYAANEAMSILFSETAAEGFSGLSISFGSGMANCALAISSLEGLSFSIQGCGDWIDQGAARAVGSTAARMCAIKESGFSLLDPHGREEEALSLYYKSMIENCLDNVSQQFQLVKGKFAVPKPIPLVIAGGTSMAGGFKEFFEQVFNKKRRKFPIEITEIRQARDPMNAVAQGLLLLAQQEYSD